MILIYEYATNGSLEAYLGDNNNLTNLTWAKRIKISIDIAHGLHYLHEETEEKKECIIHRDIKSANILLDDKWEAKIADFGLSKLHPTHKERSTLISGNIGGTQVYLDPEYEKTGHLKTSSDIYSFGVVLCEIMSGNLAYDNMYSTMGLPSIVRQWFNDGTIENLVDPQMKEYGQNTFVLNDGLNYDSLHTFLKIACQCVAEAQTQRPTMKVILKELEKSLNLQEDCEIWFPRLPKDYAKLYDMLGEDIIPGRFKDFYDMLCAGFFFQEGKAWFSLGSNGKRNVMISATQLSYQHSYKKRQLSIPESRFRVVVKMLDLKNMKVQIKIKPQLLLPGNNYGVHLVFKFREPVKCLAKHMYVNLKYKWGNLNLHSYFATWREDGWMMIELCQLLNYKEDTEFEVLLESFSQSYCGSNVYIEGIEFRTIDNEYQKTLKCEEIKKPKEVQHSAVDSKKILKSSGNANEGFLLNEQNEKICFMLLEMEAPYESSIAKPFHLKYSAQSRSQVEIELSKEQVFAIKGKIDSQMLSPDTYYMCYLVFKISETCHGLHCPVKVRNVLKWKNKEIGLICFRPPCPWNLLDTNRAPKERGDGWMEVFVCKLNSSSDLRSNHIPMHLKFITYEGTMRGLIVKGLEIRPM